MDNIVLHRWEVLALLNRRLLRLYRPVSDRSYNRQDYWVLESWHANNSSIGVPFAYEVVPGLGIDTSAVKWQNAETMPNQAVRIGLHLNAVEIGRSLATMTDNEAIASGIVRQGDRYYSDPLNEETAALTPTWSYWKFWNSTWWEYNVQHNPMVWTLHINPNFQRLRI